MKYWLAVQHTLDEEDVHRFTPLAQVPVQAVVHDAAPTPL